MPPSHIKEPSKSVQPILRKMGTTKTKAIIWILKLDNKLINAGIFTKYVLKPRAYHAPTLYPRTIKIRSANPEINAHNETKGPNLNI